jgi:hypothetical protein
MNIFRNGSAFRAGSGPWTDRSLQFTCFDKTTVATLFHVNSSLAAGRNGGDLALLQYRDTMLPTHHEMRTFP